MTFLKDRFQNNGNAKNLSASKQEYTEQCELASINVFEITDYCVKDRIYIKLYMYNKQLFHFQSTFY